MSRRFRPTWAEIDLDALSGNYNALRHLSQGKTLIPVVKADAYGHGAKEVVMHLHEHHGVDLFAVSLIEEALELKTLKLDIDILIMGPIKPQDLPCLAENGLIFTLTNDTVYHSMKASSVNYRFHVKADTGMHRLGFTDVPTILDVFHEAQKRNGWSLEGVFTHFATSDSDESYLSRQYNAFHSIMEQLPYLPAMVHVSNSSAVVKYEKDMNLTTHTRTGISLYGYSLEGRLSYLSPVMTLKSQIVEIKHLSPGDYLGYGITYRASSHERIGILPIGYADGWIRKNQDGMVWIKGGTYRMVGSVCMDMTFVKIDENIELYDDVILFGNKHIDADHVAQRLGTISYEVLCDVGKRVPRIYKTVRK